MTPEDEKFERIAQRHIADLKKSSKSIVEDATVRAVQKVMAEFAQGAHTEAKVEYHATMIQCPHCDGSVRVPAQPYPDNFIDALKYDVAKRDSEAQQAYEDAFINGTGVMLGDKRIDPASIYKEPEQEPVAWVNQANLNSAAIQRNRGGQGDTHTWSETPNAYHPIPLYTTPPQRKPLTDDQIMEMYNEPRSDAEMLEFARAIEAAHGIKGDA